MVRVIALIAHFRKQSEGGRNRVRKSYFKRECITLCPSPGWEGGVRVIHGMFIACRRQTRTEQAKQAIPEQAFHYFVVSLDSDFFPV